MPGLELFSSINSTPAAEPSTHTPVKEEAPESFYVSKYGALGPVLQKLFASGVEARGVERVPEDQCDPKHTWNK